jgi:hypothetical protein
MLLFLLANVACTGFVTLALARIHREQPHLFLKPSILLLAYTHALFQWPLAIRSFHYFETLTDPWALAVLVHGFALTGLLLSVRLAAKPARMLWHRVGEWGTLRDDAELDRWIRVLAVAATAGIGVYLAYVPLDRTGLWALLFDPAHAPEIREESLKLLKDAVPRYVFSLTTTSVAQLLIALLVVRFIARPRRWLETITGLAIAAAMALFVMLAGEKSRVVYLLLVAAAAVLWHARLRIRVRTLALLGGVAFAAVATMILLRMEPDSFAELLRLIPVSIESIATRSLFTPLEVGAWYVQYAQTNGTFGIAGIPRLAGLFGVAPVDVPNVVGLAFAPLHYGVNKVGYLATISASVGYLFAWYAYFGAASLIASVALLLALDVCVPLLLRVTPTLLLPGMAVITFQTLMFAQSDYTVTWVSHGLGFTLLLLLVLSHARRFATAALPDATRGVLS